MPDAPTYFVDRQLGTNIGHALRAAGLLVELHQDHFADNASDADWLTVAGARGWVVLTRDKRIRHRPMEIQAVKSARVRVLVLAVRANLRSEQMLELILSHQVAIERIVAMHPPPFMAAVTRAGVRLYDI